MSTATAPDEIQNEIPTNAVELIALLVRQCTSCPLHETRSNAVPGEGTATAQVMIVAEGPGENEDKQGRPFVGAAGKFLDKLLPTAELDRNHVFITNVLKCRAPGNRDPEQEEMEKCTPHLERQILAIRPEIIITLGRFATSYLTGVPTNSGTWGRLRNIEGRFILPIMHPAAGLRNGKLKEQIKNHFAAIPALRAQLRTNPPAPETRPKKDARTDDSAQKTLF